MVSKLFTLHYIAYAAKADPATGTPAPPGVSPLEPTAAPGPAGQLLFKHRPRCVYTSNNCLVLVFEAIHPWPLILPPQPPC